MTPSKLYYIAVGVGSVQIPQIDPVGLDILIWALEDQYYFVEVANGQIYSIPDLMALMAVMPFPVDFTIGVLDKGKVGLITSHRLQ